MLVNKAVIPVGGLGTRLFPATKVIPKNMLAVVDKPLIQYAVEEVIRAGIKEVIFVTGEKKEIEHHFTPDVQLENQLRLQNKNALLALLQDITPSNIQLSYVQQQYPLGLGHAILCAEHAVGAEPFVVLLPDVLLAMPQSSCLTAMCDQYALYGKSVVAVQPVPWDEVHKYGIVTVDDLMQENTPIKEIIEKPARSQVSSNLAVLGRYLFTPDIFSSLKFIDIDGRDEIQLTHGISKLIKRDTVYTHRYSGKYFDCGSKLGYLQANVEFGLQHAEIGSFFREYLKTLSSMDAF